MSDKDVQKWHKITIAKVLISLLRKMTNFNKLKTFRGLETQEKFPNESFLDVATQHLDELT